jgi:hypothetical protein
MKLAHKVTAAVVIATLTLASAASPSFAYSKSYCQNYAKNVADHEANPGNVVLGTAAGALGGFVLGSIIGGRHGGGVGALAGGAGGLAVSGIHTSKKWHRTYDQAYAYCRNR